MRTHILLAALLGYALADSKDPSVINATLHYGSLDPMAYATMVVADLSLPYSVGDQMKAGGLAQLIIGWDFSNNAYLEQWTS